VSIDTTFLRRCIISLECAVRDIERLADYFASNLQADRLRFGVFSAIRPAKT
jgi:hypothetical protein